MTMRLPLTITSLRNEAAAIEVTQPYDTDQVFVAGHRICWIAVAGVEGEYVGRGETGTLALGRAVEQALTHAGKR